jgi:hypothetical protein
MLSEPHRRFDGRWTVSYCSYPSGFQRFLALKSDQVPEGTPLLAQNSFLNTLQVQAPPQTTAFAICRSDRRDIDMVIQRNALHQFEKEKQINRMESHIQSRRFDRSFAIHALKILVLEAARYQRTFYDAQTGKPTQALLTAQAPERQSCQIHSFMMLIDTDLHALLEDVDILLDPTQTVDRSENTLQQLVGLSLFTPSTFPLHAGEKLLRPKSSKAQ